MLKMFAVIYRNNSLGLKKTFPCNYKGMEQIKKHFDKLTIGNGNNAIIMGNKTERQLPILPKRESIILGKKFKDLNEIDKKKYEDLWIIGGEKTFNSLIYHHDLKQIHTIEIDQDILSDSYFPEIPLNFKLFTDVKYENNFLKYKKKIYIKENCKTYIPTFVNL